MKRSVPPASGAAPATLFAAGSGLAVASTRPNTRSTPCSASQPKGLAVSLHRLCPSRLPSGSAFSSGPAADGAGAVSGRGSASFTAGGCTRRRPQPTRTLSARLAAVAMPSPSATPCGSSTTQLSVGSAAVPMAALSAYMPSATTSASRPCHAASRHSPSSKRTSSAPSAVHEASSRALLALCAHAMETQTRHIAKQITIFFAIVGTRF